LINYDRPRAHALSEKAREDIAFLTHAFGDDWRPASRSEDDLLAVIDVSSDVKPSIFYLYDRAAKTLTKLFDARPELADAPLAAMRPIVIKSRDGLDLVSYLTLPKESDGSAPGHPEKPLPLVLQVHGGPWGRVGFGFSPSVQWLANRGYATLAVNFRSSTGFGKAFANAGDREWGRKMDDDLLDAVAWAVESKIADPAHIAIMGGSYGGYATLASMARNPDVYACGVDLFGPSDLDALLRTVPPYWAAGRARWVNALGDPATPEGQALLKERSPLLHADRIKKPLMIVQGDRDPRVVKAHSDEIVSALQARDVPVTYVVVGNEGHGFTQPENNIALHALTESFLKSCLGGRAEPIHADEMTGTTLEVPVGADRIEGFKGLASGASPAN
jgi:dipeptidyl aminopeptidase/acylaminoacyl peptidase